VPIAYACYLLIGVTAAGFGVPGAKSTVIFYLVAYVATTLGAFTVASWVGRKGDECQNVDDWAGLARRRPAIALVMTLFMLSLGGFPPTGGFFAKFYLFRAAVERPELVWLVVAAVLNSLVSGQVVRIYADTVAGWRRARAKRAWGRGWAGRP